jgi:hypothetical protein
MLALDLSDKKDLRRAVPCSVRCIRIEEATAE